MAEPTTEFNFSYETTSEEPRQIPLKRGDIIFVLGANGTGKSGLMARLSLQNRGVATRILAHRKTWFRSNAVDLTASSKIIFENQIRACDETSSSRWADNQGDQRSQITIMNLIQAENATARTVRETLRTNPGKASRLSREESSLEKLNGLLELSNLQINISINDNEQVLSTKNSGKPYSIAQLSDGERNAILIATEVRTAQSGTLLLIDEPERHLHRSIISPLLSSLFHERKDCAFVIATHDTSLPLDSPNSRVLALRSCVCEEGAVTAWDADLITPATAGIDEKVKMQIIGARRMVLFVEGNCNSLDCSIYSILFPKISVIPQGSCADVQQAVKGVAATDSMNWVRAFGLIDADDRQPGDLAALKSQNIYALQAYSVESIYYSQEMMKNIADRVSHIHGGNASELVSEANKKVLDIVAGHEDRMCARVCERKIRNAVRFPSWKDIQGGTLFKYEIDLKATYDAEKDHFKRLHNSRDVEAIIGRYPIRETPVLHEIATALKFQDRNDYEGAVRKLLRDNSEIRLRTAQSLGDIAAEISRPVALAAAG